MRLREDLSDMPALCVREDTPVMRMVYEARDQPTLCVMHRAHG